MYKIGDRLEFELDDSKKCEIVEFLDNDKDNRKQFKCKVDNSFLSINLKESLKATESGLADAEGYYWDLEKTPKE